MDLLEKIIENAVRLQNHIVLPEGSEIRTLRATAQILKDKIARITLLGTLRLLRQLSVKKAFPFRVRRSWILQPTVAGRNMLRKWLN